MTAPPWLESPSGVVYTHVQQGDQWAVANLPDRPEAGEWTLHVFGVPESRIKVRLLYDVNLEVQIGRLEQDQKGRELPAGADFLTGVPLNIPISVFSGQEYASGEDDFFGLETTLTVTDEAGQKVSLLEDPEPVSGGDGLLASCTLPEEGKYTLAASVVIPLVDSNRTFQSDPVYITAGDAVKSSAPQNQPPEPVRSPVPYTTWVFPWSGPWEVELRNLAKDAEDQDDNDLRYEVISPANAKFDAVSRILTDKPAPGSERTYVVKVTDTEGESCEIKLELTARNGWLPLVIPAGLLLLALLIFLIYRLKNPPFFHGEIAVSSVIDGKHNKGGTLAPSTNSRGIFPLGQFSRFNIGNVGLDYGKSVFKAQRVKKGTKSFVVFVPNIPVVNRKGEKTRRVELRDNMEVRVHVGNNVKSELILCYHEKAAAAPRKGRKPFITQPGGRY